MERTDPSEQEQESKRRIDSIVLNNQGLITHYRRRVVPRLASFLASLLSWADFEQTAQLGLVRAAHYYDPRRGKFSTFAMICIRSAVIDQLIDGRFIRLPSPLKNLKPKSARKALLCRRVLLQQDGFKPDRVLAREDGTEGQRRLDGGWLRRRLEGVLQYFTSRQRQIIRLRYGLEDGRVYTLGEVAKIFQLCRERVRQIEVGILHKLRSRHRRHLEPCRDFLDLPEE